MTRVASRHHQRTQMHKGVHPDIELRFPRRQRTERAGAAATERIRLTQTAKLTAHIAERLKFASMRFDTAYTVFNHARMNIELRSPCRGRAGLTPVPRSRPLSQREVELEPMVSGVDVLGNLRRRSAKRDWQGNRSEGRRGSVLRSARRGAGDLRRPVSQSRRSPRPVGRRPRGQRQGSASARPG